MSKGRWYTVTCVTPVLLLGVTASASATSANLLICSSTQHKHQFICSSVSFLGETWVESIQIVICKEGTSWTGCRDWFQKEFRSYWINRNSLFPAPLTPYAHQLNSSSAPNAAHMLICSSAQQQHQLICWYAHLLIFSSISISIIINVSISSSISLVPSASASASAHLFICSYIHLLICWSADLVISSSPHLLSISISITITLA